MSNLIGGKTSYIINRKEEDVKRTRFTEWLCA